MLLRIYLLSSLVAAGASLTTCRIWQTAIDGGADLAVDVGATSCLAKVGISQVDAQFETADSIFFNAGVHGSRVFQDGAPYGSASLVADVSDVLTFYGVPAGSTFILEWTLLVNRVDADAYVQFLDSPIFWSGLNTQGNNFLPIIDGNVGISASISATTVGSGRGEWILSLGTDFGIKKFSRVIDVDGNPVTGFTYSAASGRRFYIPDGTQVQAVPEPGTWALLIVPFFWLATKRRIRGSACS